MTRFRFLYLALIFAVVAYFWLLVGFYNWTVVFVLDAGALFFSGFITGPAHYSRCPRCRHFFFLRFLAWSRTKDHCAHCGLPLDTWWNATDENVSIVRAWLANPEPRGAIPSVGLHCPKCEYDLTGLTDRICPECGEAFNAKLLFADVLTSR